MSQIENEAWTLLLQKRANCDYLKGGRGGEKKRREDVPVKGKVDDCDLAQVLTPSGGRKRGVKHSKRFGPPQEGGKREKGGKREEKKTATGMSLRQREKMKGRWFNFCMGEKMRPPPIVC